MTDIPIIFSAPMVCALLDGRKTQTRRVERPGAKRIPFKIGDRLWVRENWQHAPQRYCTCPQGSEPAPCDDWSDGTGCKSNRDGVVYAADGGKAPRWRPSIHMPRWASRLTLIVQSVKRERLQDISEADAIMEGLIKLRASGLWVINNGDQRFGRAWNDPRNTYAWLWDSIHGPGSWDKNPWVIAPSFRVVGANIDTIDADGRPLD